MAFTLAAAAAALLLLAGMLACMWAGRRVGLRTRRDGAEASETGALDAGVFGLFGLLIAFTFSGAATRFDARRELVVKEANAIGTAWLRVDLLPREAQPELRDLFRRYADARIALSGRDPGDAGATADLARCAALQGELWTRATEAARATGNPGVVTLVAASLNDMIDLTTTRAAAWQMHPPSVVFVLLFGLGLASSFLAGLASARSARLEWTHALVFACVIAAAVYVILDLEYPRLGLIRVDAIDRFLIEVRQSMR